MSASSSNISLWLRTRSKALSNLSNLSYFSNVPGIVAYGCSCDQGRFLEAAADVEYGIEGFDNWEG